jgi:hypothetical protein
MDIAVGGAGHRDVTFTVRRRPGLAALFAWRLEAPVSRGRPLHRTRAPLCRLRRMGVESSAFGPPHARARGPARRNRLVRSQNRLARSRNRLIAYPHQGRDPRNLDRASPLSLRSTRALNPRSRPPIGTWHPLALRDGSPPSRHEPTPLGARIPQRQNITPRLDRCRSSGDSSRGSKVRPSPERGHRSSEVGVLIVRSRCAHRASKGDKSRSRGRRSLGLDPRNPLRVARRAR